MTSEDIKHQLIIIIWQRLEKVPKAVLGRCGYTPASIAFRHLPPKEGCRKPVRGVWFCPSYFLISYFPASHCLCRLRRSAPRLDTGLGAELDIVAKFPLSVVESEFTD